MTGLALWDRSAGPRPTHTHCLGRLSEVSGVACEEPHFRKVTPPVREKRSQEKTPLLRAPHPPRPRAGPGLGEEADGAVSPRGEDPRLGGVEGHV